MTQSRGVADWMREKDLDLQHLIEKCGLSKKVLEAIIEGRYTPSPQQRQKVAAALGVELEQLNWGHTNTVEHMYGHGPQFGRTP